MRYVVVRYMYTCVVYVSEGPGLTVMLSMLTCGAQWFVKCIPVSCAYLKVQV